jgi:hypothetical protein
MTAVEIIFCMIAGPFALITIPLLWYVFYKIMGKRK